MNRSQLPVQTPVRGHTLLTALSLAVIAACLLVLLLATRAALIAFGERSSTARLARNAGNKCWYQWHSPGYLC
jgi:hypothetical protein